MYRHRELITFWLDGGEVEYLSDGVWRLLPPATTARKMPHFYVDGQYRRRDTVVRVRIGKVSGRRVTVSTLLEEASLQRTRGFEGWVTDWLEVRP